MTLSADIRAWATALAAELAQAQHRVALVPAPRPCFVGHRIRRAVDVLPDWYRSLMAGRPSRRTDRRRHFQTAIKRRWCLLGLRQIASGRPARYADLLLPLIQAQIDKDEAQARHLAEVYG